jgi:protein-S-isoprenylcysteine O-methyltransferase Ste14
MRRVAIINKRIVRYVPRCLFFIGTAVLIAGIARQFVLTPRSLHVAGGVFLICYFGWLLLETPVTFQRARAEPADAATLLAYGTARLGLVVAATVLPIEWRHWTDWLLLPFAVFFAGVALRVVAMRTLGRWYSHHVARGAGQRTVTSGPYRFIRHPAYTGMLVAHVALVAFFLNTLSLLFMAALTAAVVWRLLVEERVLRDMPGYSTYAAGRRRLIPGVW